MTWRSSPLLSVLWEKINLLLFSFSLIHAELKSECVPMGFFKINWSCVNVWITNLVMSGILDGLYTRSLFRSWGKLSEHGNVINGEAPCDLPSYLRNYKIQLIYMTSFFVLYCTIDLLKAILLWTALSKRTFSEFWSALQVFNIFMLIAKGLFWSIHEAQVLALAAGLTAIIWSIALLGYILHVNSPSIKLSRSIKPPVFVSNNENTKNMQHVEEEHGHCRLPVCSALKSSPSQDSDFANCTDLPETSVHYQTVISKSVAGSRSGRQLPNECIMMMKGVSREVRLDMASRICGAYFPVVLNESSSRRGSNPEETSQDNKKAKRISISSENGLTKGNVEAATSEEIARDERYSIETVTRQCEVVPELSSYASSEFEVTELRQSVVETTAKTDNANEDMEEKPMNDATALSCTH